LVAMTALPSTLSVGDAVTIYPGCDGSYATCLNKFANLKNFFGFPFMPNKNPFSQGFR
jgi:hypothetical protein